MTAAPEDEHDGVFRSSQLRKIFGWPDPAKNRISIDGKAWKSPSSIDQIARESFWTAPPKPITKRVFPGIKTWIRYITLDVRLENPGWDINLHYLNGIGVRARAGFAVDKTGDEDQTSLTNSPVLYVHT